MNRREFFKFLPSAAVAAPLIIRDIATDPNATGEVILENGAVIHDSVFKGVTVRIVGNNKVAITGSQFMGVVEGGAIRLG